jgi:amidase/6-aminohexanoate-cyclic-dimer hydrolase
MREAMGVIIAGNLHFNLHRYWAARGLPPGPDGLEPITWLWAEQGSRLTAADYAGAIHTVHTLGRQHAAFLQRYDVVLSPVLAQPPLPLGATDTGDDLDAYRATLSLMPFTSIYNLSGCPAMSVPLYWNVAGLPVGVQFGADNGNEFTLLQLAAQLERARPWCRRRPPLP